MAAFKSLQQKLSNMSQSIAASGRPSRPETPDPSTPRQNTSLLEDEVGVLKWTLRGVPTPAQLALDVLEQHLRSKLHAYAVDTCDPSMADLIASDWNVDFQPIQDRWGRGCRLKFINKDLCDYAAKIVAGKVAKVVEYRQLINNVPEEFRLHVVDSTLGALGIGQVQSRMPREFDSNKRYAARPDTYRLMYEDLESSYLGTSHQPAPRNVL